EPMREVIGGLVERFIERPLDENVADSLAAVLTEPLEAEFLEKTVICFSQVPDSSAARFFLMEAQASEIALVAQALMDRDPSVPRLYAQVVAGAVMSAGYAATMTWVNESRGEVNDSTR